MKLLLLSSSCKELQPKLFTYIFWTVNKILRIKHEKIKPVTEVGKGQTALLDVIRVGALAYIAKSLAEDIKNLSDAGNKSAMKILNKWLKKRYEVTTGALGTDNAQLILNKYTSLFNAVCEQYEKTTKTQNVIKVFVWLEICLNVTKTYQKSLTL